MTPFIRRILSSTAATAAVLLLPAAALATSMIPVNLPTIVDKSEKAFVGTVVSSERVETARGWADRITVRVTEDVYGTAEGEEVTWLQKRISEAQDIPGMPKYEAGGEHLIFLAGKGPGADFQAPYALGQGSFRVHRNADTGEALVRSEFLNAQLFTGADTDAIADAMLDGNPQTRSLAGERREAARKRMAITLTNRRAGASNLSTVTDAARAIKRAPNRARFARAGASGDQPPAVILQGHGTN